MKERETVIFRVHTAEYETEITEKFKNRTRWEQPNLNMLYSFMPGTILEIVAKEGDSLKEGDPLLIFEAMKMHNTVQMPFDGKVKSIKVAIGDVIPRGHLMIEVE